MRGANLDVHLQQRAWLVVMERQNHHLLMLRIHNKQTQLEREKRRNENKQNNLSKEK